MVVAHVDFDSLRAWILGAKRSTADGPRIERPGIEYVIKEPAHLVAMERTE
jgi:hypothetical protein